MTIFCFAGRRPNMELQLPFIKRILADHPNASYHIWNLARDRSDYDWLNTIEGERILVLDDGFSMNPWVRFNDVYQHYAQDCYRNQLFVKLDDDVVFLEANRFGRFIEAVERNRERIVSAKVINNGACTRTEPGLWKAFRNLRQPLLDVHMSKKYLEMSHNYFFDHFDELIGQDFDEISTDDWLSINCIGYDYDMAVRIAGLIGQPSPREIAGRVFGKNATLGDEGLVNTLPRIILQGFMACHLYFGPQARRVRETAFDAFRAQYQQCSDVYLGVTSWAKLIESGQGPYGRLA